MAGGLFVLIFVFMGSLMSKNYQDYQADILPNLLVEMANQSRTVNHLSELKPSPLLKKAAQLKAQDMVKNGYFAHTSPDGKTPWYWFQKVSYKYLYAGENLAVNFDDNQEVNDAWLNSTLHRANILSKRFTEIGIAAAEGIYKGNKSTFVVVMFAVPSSSSSISAK